MDASAFYRGRAVLVLGGAGFLGSRVARRAAALGARVTVVDALVPYAGGNLFNLRDLREGGEIVEADVRVMPDLAARVAASDLVIDAMGTTGHRWAYEHPVLDLDCNLGSHLALLEALRATRSRPHVLLLSTRAVYGRARTQPVDERHPTEPVDVQGVHKLAAERDLALLGERLGLSITMFRLGNCFGPGQRLRGEDVGIAGGFLRDVLMGRTATVYGGVDRRRDFLFGDDAADAVLAGGVLKREGVAVFNVGGGPVRLVEVAQMIASRAGRGGVQLAPFPDEVARLDVGEFLLDCSAANAELGWRPRTALGRAVDETVEYYAANGRHYGLGD